MKDETSEIVVIVHDDGITPLQTISNDNFISYKYSGKNAIEVTVNTIEFPHNRYQKTCIHFNIHPHNELVLKKLQRWTLSKS